VARFPKIHTGPFNAQCLFMDNPRNIMLKVIQCLTNRLNMKYQELDAYSLQVADSEQISVESIQGVAGYYLLKFSTNHPLNEAIVDYVAR
jgi:hypothetical protein